MESGEESSNKMVENLKTKIKSLKNDLIEKEKQ